MGSSGIFAREGKAEVRADGAPFCCRADKDASAPPVGTKAPCPIGGKLGGGTCPGILWELQISTSE